MKKRRGAIGFLLVAEMFALLSAIGCGSFKLSLPENDGQYESEQDDEIVDTEESSRQTNSYTQQQGQSLQEDFETEKNSAQNDNYVQRHETSAPAQPVFSLREYVFPMGDVPGFSVKQGNYHQNMPMISYEVFDCSGLLFDKLSADVSIEERDTDNDGYIDEVRGIGDTVMWAFKDNNRDGNFDFCVALESNFDSTIDFRIEWRDHDENGTMDEVTIHITNTDDLGKGVFSTQYLYGDFSDIDFDTGKADYTNKNRVQFIQAVTLPENSPFDEQQLFRDLNGDGTIDWMQSRKYYDTNDDGVKESTKISNDRDMDGVFEDEFVFDGKILDNSLIY